MKNTIVIIPLLVTGLARGQSTGPTIINAAGNTATIAGNRFDWSVGEMCMVSTLTTPAISVTQGILQPVERDHTGTASHSLLPKQLQVFPNPATSIVNIQYSSAINGTLTYRLIAMDGKIIVQKTLKVKPGIVSEQINIYALACATYMLQVTVQADHATEESISYKIEKLN